jgi:hypothetical protein
LKKHLGELLSQFPNLKLLTGDAIFAQRPLLEVLKNHQIDYVFQVKDNQSDALDAVKVTFKKRHEKKPAAQSFSKKRLRREAAALGGFGKCGLDSCCAGRAELPQYFLCGMDIESRRGEAGGSIFH